MHFDLIKNIYNYNSNKIHLNNEMILCAGMMKFHDIIMTLLIINID